MADASAAVDVVPPTSHVRGSLAEAPAPARVAGSTNTGNAQSLSGGVGVLPNEPAKGSCPRDNYIDSSSQSDSDSGTQSHAARPAPGGDAATATTVANLAHAQGVDYDTSAQQAADHPPTQSKVNGATRAVSTPCKRTFEATSPDTTASPCGAQLIRDKRQRDSPSVQPCVSGAATQGLLSASGGPHPPQRDTADYDSDDSSRGGGVPGTSSPLPSEEAAAATTKASPPRTQGGVHGTSVPLVVVPNAAAATAQQAADHPQTPLKGYQAGRVTLPLQIDLDYVSDDSSSGGGSPGSLSDSDSSVLHGPANQHEQTATSDQATHVQRTPDPTPAPQATDPPAGSPAGVNAPAETTDAELDHLHPAQTGPAPPPAPAPAPTSQAFTAALLHFFNTPGLTTSDAALEAIRTLMTTATGVNIDADQWQQASRDARATLGARNATETYASVAKRSDRNGRNTYTRGRNTYTRVTKNAQGPRPARERAPEATSSRSTSSTNGSSDRDCAGSGNWGSSSTGSDSGSNSKGSSSDNSGSGGRSDHGTQQATSPGTQSLRVRIMPTTAARAAFSVDAVRSALTQSGGYSRLYPVRRPSTNTVAYVYVTLTSKRQMSAGLAGQWGNSKRPEWVVSHARPHAPGASPQRRKPGTTGRFELRVTPVNGNRLPLSYYHVRRALKQRGIRAPITLDMLNSGSGSYTVYVTLPADTAAAAAEAFDSKVTLLAEGGGRWTFQTQARPTVW
jgi:hypothetical protein